MKPLCPHCHNPIEITLTPGRDVVCPACGSTVYWEGEGFPGHVAVAIGNFADPAFPAPAIAVWEEARHPWVSLPPDTPPKRMAKQG